jgi:hypothetical protein
MPAKLIGAGAGVAVGTVGGADMDGGGGMYAGLYRLRLTATAVDDDVAVGAGEAAGLG